MNDRTSPYHEPSDFWNDPDRWQGVNDPHKEPFWTVERDSRFIRGLTAAMKAEFGIVIHHHEGRIIRHDQRPFTDAQHGYIIGYEKAWMDLTDIIEGKDQ